MMSLNRKSNLKILTGIKVIKLYAWEIPFQNIIKKVPQLTSLSMSAYKFSCPRSEKLKWGC